MVVIKFVDNCQQMNDRCVILIFFLLKSYSYGKKMMRIHGNIKKRGLPFGDPFVCFFMKFLPSDA